MKFYKCEGCGKIVVVFRESKCPTKCCGEAMVEVVPGTVDAAREKHIPERAVKRDYYIVKVLQLLENSEYAEDCVFKGGTSLSKCYPGSIERFSEDIDLTFYATDGLSRKEIERKLKAIERLMTEGADTELITDERSGTNKSIYFWYGDRENKIKLEIGSSVKPDPFTKRSLKTYIQEYLEGMKIVKSCNLEGESFDKLNQALLRLKKISVKVELAVGVFMSSASMVLQAGIGLTVFVGCKLLIAESVDLLTLLMFFLMATRLYGPILAILGQLSTLLNLDVVTDRMRKLLRTPEMSGSENAPEDKSIVLRNVSFGYNKEKVISNVSMEIKQGSVNALVGPSGSGKSTVTKLISRFWDVDEGEILYGGKI